MRLWIELVSDWVGILSLLVIVLVLGMGAWYVQYFIKKMNEDPVPANGASSKP